MKTLQKTFTAFVLLLIGFACDQGDQQSPLRVIPDTPLFMELPISPDARKSMDDKYAVYMAEYLTTSESGQVGRTVYFKNTGNKQLGADFVPGLSLDGTDAVSFYVDQNRPSGDLDVSASSAAITRAMETWNGVTCSQLALYNIPFTRKTTTGYVGALLGFGGSYDYVADVVHAGWLPAAFFDLLGPEGSTYILGVTFTIIFTDANGNPVDVDANGKADVAWREIYYNDAFPWADGTHYDVETIALHEAGHGLSQAHFGTAFADAGSGQLHFSPRAVMNAAYSGIQTQVGETDNAGHCSLWSDWPNN